MISTTLGRHYPLWAAVGFLTFWTPSVHADPFPMPTTLQPQVEFWIKMFTRYPSTQIIIHDEDDLGIIYQVLDLKNHYEATRVLIQDAVHDTKTTLRHIIQKNFYNLTEDEINLLEKIPRPRSLQRLQSLLNTIRYQPGQSDAFRQGVIRSGQYLTMIRSIFSNHGIPPDLAYLAHVESAFNPAATSKYGAAGMWQFTHSTGREFLNISYAVDERRDPELSTRAAAKLLSENYRALKTWPLAITAYNHGRKGVQRLVDKFQTRNIKTIVQYKGGSFLFASRNFYASFLAARYIANNPEYFFPGIQLADPLITETLTTPRELFVTDLTSPYLPVQLFKQLNPALSSSVIQGYRSIPAGTKLHIPPSQKVALLAKWEGRRTPASTQPAPKSLAKPKPTRPEPVSKSSKTDAGPSAFSLISRDSQTIVQTYGFEFLRPRPVVKNPELAALKTLPRETLSLIAKWGDIPIVALQRHNPTLPDQDLGLGTAVWVPQPYTQTLHKRRTQYYEQLAAAYLSLYPLTKLKPIVLDTPTTLETYAQQLTHIPLWLFLMFNPKFFILPKLFKGEVVYTPMLELPHRGHY